MPSLPISSEANDATASDSETSYVPRSPTSPLSPPAELVGQPIDMPQSPPAATGYNSLIVLRYLLSRIEETSQEGEIRATVTNEAQAACHNRIDELESLVVRLQIRSEVQAIRSQRSQMTNQTPQNENRREMTAALTEQVWILRDLLVQLRASTEPTPQEPNTTTNARAPAFEHTNRRRNNRNPERRSQGDGARILYIGGGPPPNAPSTAQQQLYCKYHRCAGHETTECRQLKELLLAKYHKGEIAIRNDDPPGSSTPNLWNLRQQHRRENPGPNERGKKRNRENELDAPPYLRRRINIIMGGLASCNDSVRSILAHQRRGDIANRWNAWNRKETKTFGAPTMNGDTMTFDDADAEGVNFPHNDPLVIEVMVADCEVSRVLVDTGSSVNLIFRETLQKMEL